MRVIMTGGGTGGHIYPAVAIADEIRRRDENAEILFVGAEIGMEGDLVPKCGYEITLIPADGFNRKKLS
ncbi:MAG: glycosyltransferase, partial [Firmicutes bacterium]|nr:glycosyltransferase [Bacillota bacterium]